MHAVSAERSLSTAITMKTASKLKGRALAQTASVHLDANTITAPGDSECPHVQ